MGGTRGVEWVVTRVVGWVDVPRGLVCVCVCVWHVHVCMCAYVCVCVKEDAVTKTKSYSVFWHQMKE